MLAVSAAALGRRVHLVDAASAGDVGAQAALLGVAPAALAAGVAPVSATLTLAHLAAGDTLALAGALGEARSAADLVVVDAGSRLESVRAVLDAALATAPATGTAARNPAALLLVVTGSDALALAAAYAWIKACAGDGAPGAVAAEVVVVGGDPAAAAAACAHLDEAARHFLARPVRLAAAVPDDPSLAVALGAGMSVHDAAAGSPAAAALHALAERAAGRLAAPPARPPARPSSYAPSPALGYAPAR
jgi:MinD-like ATPase involved in chromosome partitioning or flagellar assembly